MTEGTVVLRGLAQVWIAGREARGEINGRSVGVEKARLGQLLDLYGDRPAGTLDRAGLEAWLGVVGGQAPATRRAKVGTAGRFLRWLHLEGYAAADLSVFLPRVREPRRAPRALTAGQVAAVLGACRTAAERAGVTVMVQLGLRCVEVSRLDVDDYDLDARTLFVRGKAAHERVLPVDDVTAAALADHLAVRGPRPGPLFNARGSKGAADGRLSARWISKRTGRLMRDAGVHQPGDRRSAHALRHTAASDVLDRCHDVRTVQAMLGHASLQATEVYLRRADLDRLRQAMDGRRYGHAHVS